MFLVKQGLGEEASKSEPRIFTWDWGYEGQGTGYLIIFPKLQNRSI